MGINGGPGSSVDCHHRGRALDLAQVVGKHAGQDYQIAVEKNWGARPIPADRLTTLSHDARATQHHRASTWPIWTDGSSLELPRDRAVAERMIHDHEAASPTLRRFSDFAYRLDPGSGSTPDPYEFFRDMFKFAGREASQRNEDLYSAARTDSTLGVVTATSQRDFVLHPDHSGAWINQLHFDHLHMQIGPTSDPAPESAGYDAHMAAIYRRSSGPVGPLTPCAAP